MNKYHIRWNREDYGHITIEAETEEKARELFETGEWEENQLVIKNGGMDIEDVTLIVPDLLTCELCGKDHPKSAMFNDKSCKECVENIPF